MLRTYLYIPERLQEKINHTARNQNKSKAEVIRQALEKGITQVSQQGTASAKVLLKLAELGKQQDLRGPRDSSVKIDEYLWSKDWGQDE